MSNAGPGRPPLNNHANPVTVEDYSPSRFYTRASDPQGFRHNAQLALPRDWEAIIAKVVSHLPYESEKELIRDSVFHRLRWLIDNMVTDPEILADMEAMAIRQETAERAGRVAVWSKYLTHASEAIDSYRRKGYRQGMVEEAATLRSAALTMPEPFHTEALELAKTAESLASVL